MQRALRPNIATFSWDDGHPLDNRIASLFSSNQALCTFYTPRFNSENLPTLDPADWKALSNDGFDIHSHTYNHVYLENLSPEKQFKEISDGKKFVEDATGKKDTIFCYPGGKYTAETLSLVEKAGFSYGRGIDMGYKRAYAANRFLMPTTAIVAPLTLKQVIKHAIKRRKPGKILPIFLTNKAIISSSWEHIDEKAGENVAYHFWGHSWEVEKFDLWNALEHLIRSLKEANVKIVTNQEFYESN